MWPLCPGPSFDRGDRIYHRQETRQRHSKHIREEIAHFLEHAQRAADKRDRRDCLVFPSATKGGRHSGSLGFPDWETGSQMRGEFIGPVDPRLMLSKLEGTNYYLKRSLRGFTVPRVDFKTIQNISIQLTRIFKSQLQQLGMSQQRMRLLRGETD